MDTLMTPEQQAAHNALTLPLWFEWEEFCRRFRLQSTSTDSALGGVFALRYWREARLVFYGSMDVHWVDGAYPQSDCIVAGDHYVWIGGPLTD